MHLSLSSDGGYGEYSLPDLHRVSEAAAGEARVRPDTHMTHTGIGVLQRVPGRTVRLEHLWGRSSQLFELATSERMEWLCTEILNPPTSFLMKTVRSVVQVVVTCSGWFPRCFPVGNPVVFTVLTAAR